MISSKLILFLLIALPISAANNDDEIIKNLDFFQNLELIKDENPFASVTFSKKLAPDQTNNQNIEGTDGLKNVEKKQ